MKKKKLIEMYGLKEATPFAPVPAAQTSEPTPTVNAGGASPRVTRPDVRKNLEQAESSLDKIRDGASGSPELEKIVNKFLVDIAPFLEG